MNPELIKAVRERIEAGTSREEVLREVEAAGYSADESEAAYAAAVQESAQAPVPTPPAVEQATVTPTGAVSGSAAAIALPSLGTLLRENLRLIFSRKDLIVIVIGIFLIFFVNELVQEYSEALGIREDVVTILFPVLSLLLWGVAIANLGSLVYIFSHAAERRVSYGEGLRWLNKHIGAFIWVSILAWLARSAGFLLLIVPGIIISVYLIFSLFVLAHKDVRGTNALRMSYRIVKGHWWAIAGRLLGLYLIVVPVSLLVVVATVFILSQATTLFGMLADALLLLNIIVAPTLFMLLFSVGFLLYYSVVGHMYRALAPKVNDKQQ